MKAIILFSVLLAAVLVQSHSASASQDDYSWSTYRNANGPRRFSSGDSDADTLSFLLRQRQLAQQREAFGSNTDSQASAFGNWAAYPEAASFEAKVRGRLESSRILSSKSDIRQKLMDIANEKFNQCKGKADNLERACLGHATGQVMQLVAAVENMSRNQEY